MIPPIIAGLIEYLAPILATNADVPAFSIWDGETPRYDAAGTPVGPSNVTGSWPAVDLQYQEPGFNRDHTFTNSVQDGGMIVVRVFDVTREGCETMMGYIEEALEMQISVYGNVAIGGPPDNPNYVIKMLLATYGCWQDPNSRTVNSQLLYRGDTIWECSVHTNAPTTS